MKGLKQNIAIIAATICIVAGLLAPSLSALAFANSSNTVTASVTVPSNCIVSLSTAIIAFGAINPLGNAPTTNAVTDTNDGNTAANILLAGTNWVYSSNSFFAANTIWDFSSHAGGVKGNTLGLAPGNIVDTFNVIATSQAIALYFGAQENNGLTQSPGTYSQTITIENKC